MPNKFQRYDFENPQDDADDVPSDWHSSAADWDDEYDRYEDYVTETGNDPYGLFKDDTRQLSMLVLKNRLRGLWRDLRHIWKMLTDAKYRHDENKEIPF